MRVLYFGLILLLGSSAAFGQESSIGVVPYHHPEPAKYRLSFGVGANAGRSSDAPIAYIGSATYQLGQSLYGMSFVQSVNNSRVPPRISLSELDLLYGLSFDADLTRYEASPQSIHASISAGVGFQSLNTRWRFGRRGFQLDTASLLLSGVSAQRFNTFEYSAAFPIQVQALYEPFRFAGIGLTAFLSIGKLTPSYGAALSIQARY